MNSSVVGVSGVPHSFRQVLPLIITLAFDNFSIRAHLDATAWFIARDVCAALGHSNSRIALTGLLAENVRKIPVADAIGRQQASLAVSVAGLSAILARSRKPEAVRLQTWLTQEAMPTLERLMATPSDARERPTGLPDCPMHKGVEVRHGDCAVILRTVPTGSVDCLIADPPAGIGLRDLEWDADKGGRDAWIGWLAEIMQEAYRVLKPGAHGFVWALPRRSHWTALALEQAGFEIRDRFTHIFGNGAPKPHGLHGQWEGWATNLRPSVEDWWLVRKPMAHSVTSANMDELLVGALNIAASRIPVGDAGMEGRYPTHLLFTHHPECTERCVEGCPVRELEAQSGDQCGSPLRPDYHVAAPMAKRLKSQHPIDAPFGYGDTGSAARFYHQFRICADDDMPFLYIGRAAPRERHAGCDYLPQERNSHPAVKPVKLLLHLLRLATPSNGFVLDPFAGSGSAGVAAVQGGFCYFGIEQEADYVAIANARIKHAITRS